MRRALGAGVMGLVALVCGSAVGQVAPETDRDVAAASTVGIEGRVMYRFAGDLQAAGRTAKSPVIVRIAGSAVDGEAVLYDVRFIGVKPGVFDLRESLVGADGSALAGAPVTLVRVESILPEDHTGELKTGMGVSLPRIGGYRFGAIALGVAWVGVPIVWGVRRALRRKPMEVIAESLREPTLADQLRPLAEAAMEGRATVEERSRLELLLITYWRERLGLRGMSAAGALAKLRGDGEGGALLRGVEEWLHRPRGESESGPDLGALLAPYRGAARIELAGAGGEGGNA